MDNGVKVFELTADVVRTSLIPGMKEMIGWGYNNSIPGPTIEVNEGDRVRIFQINNLPEPNSIHWHGLEVPPEMDGELCIPALKAGFVVLSDRYIYTAMARAGVRGVDRTWMRNLYGFAIAPHLVFYLHVDMKTLIGRVLESRGMDYWESGMDMKLGAA